MCWSRLNAPLNRTISDIIHWNRRISLWRAPTKFDFYLALIIESRSHNWRSIVATYKLCRSLNQFTVMQVPRSFRQRLPITITAIERLKSIEIDWDRLKPKDWNVFVHLVPAWTPSPSLLTCRREPANTLDQFARSHPQSGTSVSRKSD